LTVHEEVIVQVRVTVPESSSDMRTEIIVNSNFEFLNASVVSVGSQITVTSADAGASFGTATFGFANGRVFFDHGAFTNAFDNVSNANDIITVWI
jgi:hypothetical protein